MTNGFAGLIGRWFRRHTAESTPAQKGVFRATAVPAFTWAEPPDFSASGIAADVPPSSLQPETFEAMVGFDNLCLIARAADNLEAFLWEFLDETPAGLHIKCEDDIGPLVPVALNELRDALIPYRTAREQHYRRKP